MLRSKGESCAMQQRRTNNRTSIANQSREVGNLLAFSLRSRMAEQDLFTRA